MGARHAQLVGAGVHAGHKGVHAAGAQLSYGVGRIVAGTDDEAIEQVEKRHLFALIDRHQGTVLGHVRRAGGDGDFLIQAAALQRQQQRHDLGGAGRIELRVRLMSKQHVARRRLHHDAGLGIQVIFGQGQGCAFVKVDGRLKAIYAQVAHEQIHQTRRGHAVQLQTVQPQLDHALLKQPHGRFRIVAVDAVRIIGEEL